MIKRRRIYLSALRRSVSYYAPYDGEPAAMYFSGIDNDHKLFKARSDNEKDLIEQIKASGRFVIYNDDLDFAPRNLLELELLNQLEIKRKDE